MRRDRGLGMTERHGDRPDVPVDAPAPTITGDRNSWVIDRRTNSKAAGGGMKPTVPVSCDSPAPTLTSKTGSQWVLRNNNTSNAAERALDEPAPTLFFSARSNDVRWVRRERSGDRAEEGFDPAEGPSQTLTSKARSWAYERPATTIVGSFCPDIVAAPGYRTSTSRQNAEASIRVEVAEASILQSFPASYPWHGSRSKQFEQVGNAVPPRLAAHVLAAVIGCEVPA